MTWKYTDSSRTVAIQVNQDGSSASSEVLVIEGVPTVVMDGSTTIADPDPFPEEAIAARRNFDAMIRRRAAALNDGTAEGGFAALTLLKEFNL